jgi:TonB-linked SusC/RagA family outer membrane protein
MQFSFAQEKTVTGTVSDDLGTLAGASVVVKGTTRGVTTDFDGNYAISAKEGDVLEVSFAGKKPQTVTVGAANKYDVVLAEGFVGDEIILVGALGIKRKADEVTSSYQTVNNEELTQASNPNAVQALVGKVSGMQINTSSSGVNPTTRIVLRGLRSISGANEALVVIDNAISSATILSQLPPDIIESVNVLKGAQGAALYGAQGVNGVVVVTTKKGDAGEKMQVSFNTSYDVLDVAYLPQRQLRYGQGWDGAHSAYENGSWGPEFDGSLQPVGLVQADGSYIMAPYSPIKDNYKQFFNTGSVSQTGINVRGGTLETGYALVSVNRQVTDFVIKGDELKRNTFLVKAGKKFGKFSAEVNVNYISQQTAQSTSGLYGNLIQTASNVPVGQFENSGNEGHWNAYYLSPYWQRDNVRNSSKDDNLLAVLNLGYEINKNINISYLGNVRLLQSRDLNYNNGYDDVTSAIYGASSKSALSSLYMGTSAQRDYYGDLMVNFDYDLTEDISFKANVGNNLQDKSFQINSIGGTNLEIPGVYTYTNVLNPSLATGLNNFITASRRFAFFANVDLGYKDYLFLNLTGRNDWTSVLDSSKNNFFYPSVGVSFIPTKAIEGLKGNVLNYAKIVANYTRVGNDFGVSPYEINKVGVNGIGYPYASGNSYVQQQQPTNTFIKPEFVTTAEAGINLGFLDDRITLDASFYKTTTTDLITRTATSAATGLFSLKDNIGSMETKGFEIDFGFTPIRSKEKDGFVWSNKVNFTKYKTVVTSLSSGADNIALRTPYSWVSINAQVGEEFPLIKGSAYLRDDFGRVIVSSNGTPQIDSQQQILGKVNPDFILGYNTSFAYKGIKLSATMDYRTGHQFYSDVKRNLSWTGQLIESAENRSGFILPNSSYDYNGDGIIQQNEANTSVVTGGGSTTNFLNYYSNTYATTGENLVIDATAFKVRELALSYSLPSKWIENTGLNTMTFGVNARNPFTVLSKQNRGYNDPESAESASNSGGGLAFTDRYPVQRTYGFTLNLTF